MRDLIIIGAGSHGREALDSVEAMNAFLPQWHFVGFADDTEIHGERLRSIHRRRARWIGTSDVLEHCTADYVIGIGSSPVRSRLDKKISAWNRKAAILVHTSATVASENRIADGVIIAAGARVTTNVTLGRHVHLNVNAVVSHDSVIGDYSTLSPGVLVNGEVQLGKRVLLGSGAIVLPGVSIGDDAVIGVGSVVNRDVPPGVTVKGIPGKWLSEEDEPGFRPAPESV